MIGKLLRIVSIILLSTPSIKPFVRSVLKIYYQEKLSFPQGTSKFNLKNHVTHRFPFYSVPAEAQIQM